MAISTSFILWQSQDQTVTLIDIPCSIAAVQGTEEHPCNDILLSSSARLSPFVTNEPKSTKARSKLHANTAIIGLQHEYEVILQQALGAIESRYAGPWCLERPFIVEAGEPQQRKRKYSSNKDEPSKPTPAHSEHQDTVPNPVPEGVYDGFSPNRNADLLCLDCGDWASDFYCNPSTLPIEIDQVGGSYSHAQAERNFRMPPLSAFHLCDIAESRAFHARIRNQAQIHETRRHFDLMLLDPPWPNSSVKRTHKTPGSTYTTIARPESVSDLLLSTDLDMLMADDCLVGFWITNKPAVRELLLGQGGIFETWSLRLEEEWIWLKTTAQGVPVTPIDAVWRKPYEILLLGRRQNHSSSGNRSVTPPKRKVILGVPDLHSRKPCLKALIEPLLSRETDYRALEVFARHLVAGWWSWGNECNKFNGKSHWRQTGQSVLSDD